MRIAQFISHFLYQEQFNDNRFAKDYVCAGGELAAYYLTVNLIKLGHEVIVFTASKNDRKNIETYNGITVFRYPSIGQVGETKFAPELFWGPNEHARNIDIVHIHHTTPPGGAAGLLFARQNKKPLVVTHHGFERYDNYGSIIRRLSVYMSSKYFVDYLLKHSSAIICISPSFIGSSQFLQKYLGKTHIIPNGVNLDEYNTLIPSRIARERLGLPLDIPVVLFIGSLIPPKGADLFIKAVQKVLHHRSDVQAIIIGRGIMEQQLRNLCAQSRILENVTFTGYIGESSRKNLYYRAANVCVLPSRLSEMFPLTLLESSSSGCALVTSDLDIFRWFIQDHINGIISPAGNPELLAAGILEILQNPDLEKRLSEGAQLKANKYSWPTIAQQTEELYYKLI